ncbi:hypothetical protein FRX31_015155, partial [Thalictrum thalictroides]
AKKAKKVFRSFILAKKYLKLASQLQPGKAISFLKALRLLNFPIGYIYMARPRILFLPGKALPIGPWHTQFIREKDIKATHGSKFYDAILKKFEVDLTDPTVVKIINKYIGQSLKECRSRLHAFYKKLDDGVDKKQHPPKHVSQDAWAYICQWFETKKLQIEGFGKDNLV